MNLWSAAAPVQEAQDLEDLATASWLAETLFAAVELGVFEALQHGELAFEELARRCGAEEAALQRLAEALAALGLLSIHAGRAACTAVSSRHLVPGAPGYMGRSLAFRRRLARSWTLLADAVRTGGSPLPAPEDKGEVTYRNRVNAYLLAMDDVARHKAGLIADRLDLAGVRHPTVLDLGGGAGAISAELLRRNPGWTGTVVDMPEVVAEARQVWDERLAAGEEAALDLFTPAAGRQRLEFEGLDLLGRPLPEPPGGGEGWGVILASNIVHAYAATESGAILDRAARALAADGLLVVHDFWTDGAARGPAKAALFDLHMLIHTYQGRTYPWTWVRDRLQAQDLCVAGPVPLGDRPEAEDTSLVVGARCGEALSAVLLDPLEHLDAMARELGFVRTARIVPDAVVTAGWVQEKCRYGCAQYGRGNQCPPRTPVATDTRATLSSYGRALLVQGAPPTAEFHRLMLELERAAFLAGFHKALAFVAGPCRLCGECHPDNCVRPEHSRPSMEASGMDVYATAAAAGWPLAPVRGRGAPATYIGLLLVD